jgi:hypothetical protein
VIAFLAICFSRNNSGVAAWWLAPGLSISTYWLFKYGTFDFSKFKTTGRYKVGFKSFFSEQKGSECSIFYPTNDPYVHEVPYWTYGEKHLPGFLNGITVLSGSWFAGQFVTFMMKPLLGVKLAVARDAKPALNEMQLLVFSHGMMGHRNICATICMELASHGVAVMTLTHDDGSADFHPRRGEFSK